MSKLRLIALAGGTLVCALGIGYAMQRFVPLPAASLPANRMAEASASDTGLPSVQRGAAPVAPADPVVPKPLKAPARAAEPLEIGKIALTSAPPPEAPATAADVAGSDAPASGCEVTAEAMARPGALVELVVHAPCMAASRVVIHHHGMFFAELTDDDGRLELVVPALAEKAVFIAAFDNGDGAVALTQVPDINDFDRIALQWAGAEGFQLHAREFGATYGQPGHIWSGLSAAELKQEPALHGAVVRLGAPMALAPLTAEVYSFPAGQSDRAGSIALTVEAEITAQNCGRDISAQLLERQAEDRVKTRELELSVPDCDAIGDFLVLNNLLDDLKIAAK